LNPGDFPDRTNLGSFSTFNRTSVLATGLISGIGGKVADKREEPLPHDPDVVELFRSAATSFRHAAEFVRLPEEVVPLLCECDVIP